MRSGQFGSDANASKAAFWVESYVISEVEVMPLRAMSAYHWAAEANGCGTAWAITLLATAIMAGTSNA